jgi:hypothetical protein
MTLNQTQFGAPAGSGVDVSPLSSAMNEFFNARKGKGKELERMAGQYALDTMRDSRKFEQTKELETGRQTHAAAMQERGLTHAASEGKAGRRHETRLTKLKQSGDLDSKRLEIAGSVVTQNNAFAGITGLGKTKRVSNFSMDADGGMNVAYNKPTRRRRSSATPGAPTVVEPTTPPRSTATPDVPTGTTNVAPAVRDPKTGRAMRNPAYTSSTPPTKTATTKPRRKP